MPLMRGWFTTPRSTSRSHTTLLVKGAAEGWVVGRGEAARGKVGLWGGVKLRVAQFLANIWQGLPRSRWHERRHHRPDSPRPQATGTAGAVLSSDDCGSSVERTAKRHSLWR
jgi:hypothetical protein